MTPQEARELAERRALLRKLVGVPGIDPVALAVHIVYPSPCGAERLAAAARQVGR